MESPAPSDPDLVESHQKDKSSGRRKHSIFGNVLRRVSIHRRDSAPSSRIGMFIFGRNSDSEDDTDSDNSDGNGTANGNGTKVENGLVVGKNGTKHHSNKKAARLAARKVLLDGLFVILSGLYGILIVVLGAVIPLTEIFVQPDSGYVFEAFYLYLYLVSIIFLVYVYLYLLRRNRLKTEFLTRTLSRSMSWTKAWAKSWAKGDNESTKSNRRKRHISMDTNHHTGSFYLRLGAVGFGIGSMIHSGLQFGQYFQLYDGPEYCTNVMQAFKPFLHLLFTFIQLYLIFMNSKMCIHRYRILARFGLMHMCATNICVWFRSIVVETLHVIHQHHNSHDEHHTEHPHEIVTNGHVMNYTIGNDSHTGRQLHALPTHGGISDNKSCHWSDMMGQAVESAGPYLYPCTIEYSLMCAGILYIMWKNVGEKPSKFRSDSEDDDDDEDMRSQRMSVDCAGSSRGLFLGILLTVSAIISIIAFYVLINQKTKTVDLSAIFLTHLSETIIYSLTTLALVLAVMRMKDLHFHAERKSDLEDTLILISYTGLLGFATFSLTAAIMRIEDMRSWLTMLSNTFMVIQATLQTIFILAGDRLSAASSTQERKKPGREFVTFLLLSNFAMWALNTFETQTPQHNPIQVEVYGPDAWAIFTHVSVPLGIYFRFHSTVCLSNIWKNAWKVRKHM
ncbi:hypothetical protein SNE40_021456 [Patella caerulea]|uniref:Otopetrin-2 n=1 Tax=Patella caerulea TaxID=87958 RepID=A0AAN8FZM0_PATCE